MRIAGFSKGKVIRLTVEELLAHGFEAVSLPDGSREIDGVYIGDLLSWVMGRAQMGEGADQVSRLRLAAAGAQIETRPLVEGEDVVPVLLHARSPSRRRSMSSALVKLYLLLQKWQLSSAWPSSSMI